MRCGGSHQNMFKGLYDRFITSLFSHRLIFNELFLITNVYINFSTCMISKKALMKCDEVYVMKSTKTLENVFSYIQGCVQDHSRFVKVHGSYTVKR